MDGWLDEDNVTWACWSKWVSLPVIRGLMANGRAREDGSFIVLVDYTGQWANPIWIKTGGIKVAAGECALGM